MCRNSELYEVLWLGCVSSFPAAKTKILAGTLSSPPYVKRYKSGFVPFTRASANGAHRAPRSRVTRLTTDKMSTFFAVVDGAQGAVAALT